MPLRQPLNNIDLLESDGSSQDSYHSSQDSEGSLREFVVADDAIEESDYTSESETCSLSSADLSPDDAPAVRKRERRPRRAVRDQEPRYVLEHEQPENDSDEDYNPVAQAVFEVELELPNVHALGQLHSGVQKFLQE